MTLNSKEKLNIKLIDANGDAISQKGEYEVVRNSDSLVEYLKSFKNCITNMDLPIVDGAVYNNPKKHLHAKQFSLLEIAFFTFNFCFLLCLSYVAYVQNVQIVEFKTTISILKDNQHSLLSLLETRNQEISTLCNEISKVRGMLNTAPIADSETIRAHNEMTQFYIKVIGSVLVLTTACFTAPYFIPKFIDFSNYLPTSVFNFIQDNTYFFQTNQTFSKIDSINDLLWLVIIKNNKHLDIKIKTNDGSDYQSAISFVHSLYENSNKTVSSTTSEASTQLALSRIIDNGESLESITNAYLSCF